MANVNKKNVPFQTVIAALLDESNIFPPTYLHRFSDINKEDLHALKKVWLQANPARRQALLEDLEELAESDTVVSFDDLALYALNDPEPGVRTVAIRLLWEDQDLKLVPLFINMMENDADPMVRAAAASALGLFVYLGELEEIPAETLRSVEDNLLRTTSGADHPIVRRRALEALGYSSRPEVPSLIQSGYDSGDTEWLSSTLFAMGRSADPRWEAPVLQMLHHPDSRVQVEAVRAAGQLELASARMPLLDLLDEEMREELDDDVFIAAIWSVSQIGGETIRETLERLLESTEDDDEADYIDRAIENLSFTEDFGIFEMFDFDADHDAEDELKELGLDEETGEEGTPPTNGKKN
jgi:HEAT repeat protein